MERSGNASGGVAEGEDAPHNNDLGEKYIDTSMTSS